MDPSRQTSIVVRVLAVLAVLGLVGVLLYYLSVPGYSRSRLVLFALLGGAGVVGGVGATFRRRDLVLAGSAGLFLLGFWQAALGVFVLPVAAVLLLAAVLGEPDADTSVS